IDRPDFVTLGEVALGPLTDDILDKALMLGDREWTIAERAEVSIAGDRERLTQAWLQLAANAVKFSPSGSAITIGSAATTTGASMWVCDDGTGIEAADQERFCERFVRAGDGATGGSGLGLPSVKAIAEGHGGSVVCGSTVG